MPRRLAFLLAPLAASAIFTAIVSTRMMMAVSPPFVDEGSSGAAALDFILGSGAPLPPQSRLSPGREADAIEEDQADEDEEEELRPRKRPKGRRWGGWGQGGTNADGGASPSNADDNLWWRSSPLCFEVDRICHRRMGNEWFYYAIANDDVGGGENATSSFFQPTMELKSAPAKYDGGKDRGEPRISIRVSSSSTLGPGELIFNEGKGAIFVPGSSAGGGDPGGGGERCSISRYPTHVVLQSLFNDMIGEFYSRTLLRLHHFMTQHVERGGSGAGGVDGEGEGDDEEARNSRRAKMPWEEDVQFYVHIPYGNKRMLDGHRLLLSGMLSDPASPAARSLVELFSNTGKGDGGEGDGDAGCECYEKLVFCGYDVYVHPSEVESKDLESAKDDDEAEQDGDAGKSPPARGSATGDTKYTLWSAGKLHSELDKGSCGRAMRKSMNEYGCREWDMLRGFLSSNFVQHYPTLEEDVIDQRRAYLLQKMAVDPGYAGDTREFTVAGLTQRTYRRAWLNLDDVLDRCNTAGLEKLVCVEINVERTRSPFEQLLLHRSLDVMIGVHGAQMTQAVLLPRHAHVLELLPWVPDYIRGRWVQTTHVPTPLGVIFHNTDLNHVGYSLGRDSVPMCQLVTSGPEALQACFLRQRKNFIWENRDFTVNDDVILQYLRNFVLPGRSGGAEAGVRGCKELGDALGEGFVLYNVWCAKPPRWYPALDEGGEKACVLGAGYPVDHTNEAMQMNYLFDGWDECCSAYPVACKGARPERANEKLPSGKEVVVFHSYKEEEGRSVWELNLLPKKNKKKRRHRRRGSEPTFGEVRA